MRELIRHFINRPVSVLMAFLAFFLLGIITYMNIPVSLLPDIAIPEITVQVSRQNVSARELENTVVRRVRQQLMQISKLRDIRSETRDGSATIRLSFEYGANTDLAFIEVNEKIDAVMNSLPSGTERPRVIKASATDIPIFDLNLTLKSDLPYEGTDQERFIELSEFAETVIKRRFEQLPEVAMVDMSGMVHKQILITPDMSLLEISGITLSDLEGVLNENNVEPGSMMVKDGFYEYVISFTSVLRTIEDIRNIYIRKNDRIYRLRQLADVQMVPEKEKGVALYNGKQAIVLSVIKQSEENMSRMQRAMNETVEAFRKDFPEIEFSVSQNQTELLDYTISNLKQNLILAFIFVCLISFFFLHDGKSPLIIGLSLVVSLICCLLFFYLFHISMNVISLTGLVLALGMMIDNSIIVTDNISQYQRRGESLIDSCVDGTYEVVLPMLSSSLTTVSVFVPLIFLSGIAGAIFFDQAFSVTIGLFVSYVTGVVLLPVLYKLIYPLKFSFFSGGKKILTTEEVYDSVHFRLYEAGIEWVFRHKLVIGCLIVAVFPLCFWLFLIIPKEKMPDIKQNEGIVFIEWNENIHIEENRNRSLLFLQTLESRTEETSGLIGQQQFLLNRDGELTTSESRLYVRTADASEIPALKAYVQDYFDRHYPQALVTFSPVGTIFEKIFETGEADLVVEYYPVDQTIRIDPSLVYSIEKELSGWAGYSPVATSFQEQLNLSIDREKMLIYQVPYDRVHRALRTAFKENSFATLRSQQQYLPILLGEEEKTVAEILDHTLIEVTRGENEKPYKVSLSSFVSVTPAEDLKTIISGKAGEYIPFSFYGPTHVEKIVEKIEEKTRADQRWEIGFSGSFFSNRKMIGEMVVILLVSVMLMYFILASQFEDFVLPLVVLLEIPIDVTAALALLIGLGHSLNLMSAIGIVVTCGIIVNDSILKIDMMNQLRREGVPLMQAIHEAGRRRLNAILMTSLTSIVCMAPLLLSSDLGSELEKPLAIATIGGMVVGTPVSLFIIPLVYWAIFRKKLPGAVKEES